MKAKGSSDRQTIWIMTKWAVIRQREKEDEAVWVPVPCPLPLPACSRVNPISIPVSKCGQCKNPSRVASPLVASFHFRFSSLSVSVLTSYPVGQSVSQSFSHSISNCYNERAHHECLYIIIKIIILFVALQRNPTLSLHKWSNLRLSHCLTVCRLTVCCVTIQFPQSHFE